MVSTDEEDVEYEMDDRGRLVMVRSLEATQPLYLRFRNATRRDVEVSWRDYAGRRRLYVVLEPAAHYDINTYATHPWQFCDRATKERYVINNRATFRPPAQPPQYRTNWNITVGVRTLRRAALLAVAARLPAARHACALGLPRELANELARLVRQLARREPAREL